MMEEKSGCIAVLADLEALRFGIYVIGGMNELDVCCLVIRDLGTD